MSSESALRSLMKCVSRVISLLSTPICSLTISITFCSISSIVFIPTLCGKLKCGPHGPLSESRSGERNYSRDTIVCQSHMTILPHPRKSLAAVM